MILIILNYLSLIGRGKYYIEAKGLGVLLRKPFLASENPLTAADNLVYNEDKNRRSLYNAWKSKINY